jgi:hypothetical protein
MLIFRFATLYILFFFSLIAITALPLKAQSSHRDYMTDAEIELVRDAQDIDTRIAVLTKMIDRRFAVLKIDVGGAKIPNKETDAWGPAPTGTQEEILDDIRKLLDKAIDDVDNVATHPVKYEIDKDHPDKTKKVDEQRFPKSVKDFAAAVKRYQPALKSLLGKTTEEKEKGLIIAALESCDEVIAATTKLLADVKAN